MKKILKMLFVSNFIVLPSVNLVGCQYQEGDLPAVGDFLSELNKLFNINTFTSEQEILKKVEEIKKTIEVKYSIQIYDDKNTTVILNQNDFYLNLQFENNFFEINKKQLKIKIYSTKMVQNKYVWDENKLLTKEENVTFNLNSYGLELESEYIDDFTLKLPNDNIEKEVKITGTTNLENVYFNLFEKGESQTIYNGQIYKGEWEFRLKENGTIYFKGFNNSIDPEFTKLRVIEESNEGYKWFDLNLKGDSTATTAIEVQLNESESINAIKTNVDEYSIDKSGKLVLDMNFIDNKIDDFEIIWNNNNNNNNIFEQIEQIDENHWKLTIEPQNISNRSILIIPTSLENRTEKIFFKVV